METKAKRTLVKSAPELWELADDVRRMEAWMGGLVGSEAPVPVEITDRRPEQGLAWRASDGRLDARIELELAEKGFGTAVQITALHPGLAGDPDRALAELLDDLGSPERRPFSGPR